MPLSAFAALQTARLTVRPVDAGDLPDLMAINGDDAVTRFLPYASWQSPDDARAWLDRTTALCKDGQAHQLVMVDRDGGRVVGTLLLFRFEEASARIELGYVLGRAHWGRGIAREAIAAVLDQLFGPMGLRRAEAQVQPDNGASAALLRRLGFVHEGRLRQRWVAKGRAYDVDAWGLLAADWPGAAGLATARGRPVAERPQRHDVTISAHDAWPPAEAAIVDTGIGDSNDDAAPLHEVRPLASIARDAAGTVVGGAVGRRWGACCELQQLWVQPARRGQGIGSALVRAFEAQARSHGCDTFYLETFSFQAPAFYRALGYGTAHVLDVYPHGIARHLMVKRG